MKLKGSVEEIRFRNEENGYTIATIDSRGEPIVVVGAFPPVVEGEDIEAEGEFVTHPRFGRQFKAEKVVRIAPDTPDGIVRFLGSGLIKGVGPKTALAIVSTFRSNALDVIERSPTSLAVIRGISKAKALAIHEEYIKNKIIQDAVMYLQAQDIALGTALKIYKIYGEETIKIVSENPYRMIEDVDGIGFKIADRIAVKQGLPLDSTFRIRAGIAHALSEAEEAGNTFLPKEELVDAASLVLDVDKEEVDRQVDALVIDVKLKRADVDGYDAIFRRNVFQAENGSASGLLRLIRESDKITYDVTEDIKHFEQVGGIKLHELQKEAVKTAVTSGVSIITGGPGTGKTTVIKCIIDIAEKLGFKTMLLAPTGRAAKRMSESTGREAATIHRALMQGVGINDFKSETTPLKCNLVIVDEVSMVDVFLLNMLLKRLASGTRLVMVGDKDQLPSVGAGNVLSDVLKCGLVATAMLSKVYRQGDGSSIAESAHAVNNGIMPSLSNKSSDFFFVRCSAPEKIAATVVDLAARRIPKYLNVDAQKIQVLCPLKNGVCGTINLNSLLREQMNPHGEQLTCGDVIFRTGDKVMHVTNNYQLSWVRNKPYYETGEGVFNGDAGIVTAVKDNDIFVTLDDGREIIYTPDIRSQLMPAYAITVHKSQGSEYEGVIMPVVGGSPMMMTRNLLYTAITRAKRFVAMVGEEYNLKRMVENNYIAKRYSALSAFMRETDKQSKTLFFE